MREVHKSVVDMVGQERAAWATLLPSWTKHEMINDQLAPSVEEVGERLLAVRPLEDIRLLQSDPGQLPTVPAQLIALVRELLLFPEQLFASRNPFFLGNDFVVLNPGARF